MMNHERFIWWVRRIGLFLAATIWLIFTEVIIFSKLK